jgi:hypothetical protein
MLWFILHCRTAWNGYFPGTNSTAPLVPKEYNERQTLSDTNVHVSNCLFSRCTSTSSGGALYCSSVTRLLVESSSFISCKTSSSNGAIYFSVGQCVLHGVCGNDCCSTKSGNFQFASIRVKDDISSKNYVNYSSIARCINENSDTWSTLYLYHGKDYCPSINMSMNKCGYQSSISCYPFSDSSSTICLLSYSSFADNNATVYRCIHFDRSTSKYEMKCCNILRNTQINLNSHGTISLLGNLLLKDSCILENNAKYIFCSSSSSYLFTLTNCTVDKTTISHGSLTIQSTVTKSFIHALNHMFTDLCPAEYDSAGNISPNIPSSSKKVMCYCTCRILFNRPHLKDFVSLICIFVFNLIHLHPSVGH